MLSNNNKLLLCHVYFLYLIAITNLPETNPKLKTTYNCEPFVCFPELAILRIPRPRIKKF